jgi:hypothetical protein
MSNLYSIHRVNKFIYNDNKIKNKVVGVEYSDNASTKKGTTTQDKMDLVILTAGANCSSPEFGNVPMRENPGSLTFATISRDSSKNGKLLSKIYVDTVNKVYMLTQPQ